MSLLEAAAALIAVTVGIATPVALACHDSHWATALVGGIGAVFATLYGFVLLDLFLHWLDKRSDRRKAAEQTASRRKSA